MTPEIDKSNGYSEKSSTHQLVRGYILGEITLDEYAKLFHKVHKAPDLLEMAFGIRERNKIYNEFPSLRPKGEKSQEIIKSRRSSLETIVANWEDKKNQAIDKVMGFVKRLGIFEK